MLLSFIIGFLLGASVAAIVVTVVYLTYEVLKALIKDAFNKLKDEGKIPPTLAGAIQGVIDTIDTDKVDVHLFCGREKVGKLTVNYQSLTGLRAGMRIPVKC